ncbi:hypothetical protein BCR33DRAFT_186422 [Rhizoclosmatium globosum]|uniref:ARM repeat-containing protein n=1 Tax=Rhizoclosmatium globosum TaxID=329046 RepID=A0A1Y2D1B2_9FUNG|nr:hypothetical protein BCR33DRAFT_186422 [Rhizoclosmatium globosum]|eukprot:ORY53083.1 hypothetical protein BCR33DRAFT_186422 [Rhizoclosmatium globosum]
MTMHEYKLDVIKSLLPELLAHLWGCKFSHKRHTCWCCRPALLKSVWKRQEASWPNCSRRWYQSAHCIDHKTRLTLGKPNLPRCRTISCQNCNHNRPSPRLSTNLPCSRPIRPLIHLLDNDSSTLQQFEGLMALTNLASFDETVRSRIVAAKGVKAMEYLQFSENTMVRRAATEALCNMMFDESVFESYVAVQQVLMAVRGG